MGEGSVELLFSCFLFKLDSCVRTSKVAWRPGWRLSLDLFVPFPIAAMVNKSPFLHLNVNKYEEWLNLALLGHGLSPRSLVTSVLKVLSRGEKIPCRR